MKTTLLQIVQSILSDMDSEDVNSISDTVEAQQIASVVEDTYYNIIAAREIPEHNKLLSLTAMSDSAKPTHFKYPTNTKSIKRIEYNVGSVAEKDFQEIEWVDPVVFLDRMDETGLLVETYDGNLDIFVTTDEPPRYYTSFDDEYIIMNSYDSSVEASLQSSKSRAFGSVYPTFSQTDSFEPDIDNTMLPLLLAEAKSTCFSLFKGGSDPKVEQAARRLKSYVQNDMYKSVRPNKRTHYGRK
jgi:hypothetical protein